jgi:hypothetical protein
LAEMQNSTDTEKTDRLMKALMKMKKLDIAALKQAFDNKSVGSQTRKASADVYGL